MFWDKNILHFLQSCYDINVQKRRNETVLVVEQDPEIGDLVAYQALEAAGYQVTWLRESAAALQFAIQSPPDIIISNLEMPGLSGKDLMVALLSQGIETPVIVLAHKGREADIIQAYRLGVSDYLLWPMQEAEVLNVIERVVKHERTRRERGMFERALQKTNQELQSRLRDMRTIFSIGKAVLTVHDQAFLLSRILESACKIARAEVSWLTLRNENTPELLLAANYNLPDTFSTSLNQPWDDGISHLVALSGKPLTIQGDAFQKSKLGTLGQSAIFLPVNVQGHSIGVMVLTRKQNESFNETEQLMLDAIVDYTSLALVNARLFKAIGQR